MLSVLIAGEMPLLNAILAIMAGTCVSVELNLNHSQVALEAYSGLSSPIIPDWISK